MYVYIYTYKIYVCIYIRIYYLNTYLYVSVSSSSILTSRTVVTCVSISSKTEGSESGTDYVRGNQAVSQLQTPKTMEEYNDTRRWRCYEAALLMKKNEIRTDEEAPLNTPVDASVLEYYRASPRGTNQIAKNLQRRVRVSFLGKEKKLKAFSFSIKRNLYSSSSRIYSSIVKTWHSYQEYT